MPSLGVFTLYVGQSFLCIYIYILIYIYIWKLQLCNECLEVTWMREWEREREMEKERERERDLLKQYNDDGQGGLGSFS